jgi:hypothetical protein
MTPLVVAESPRVAASEQEFSAIAPESGRRVTLLLGMDGEELEICSPEGALELRVLLTPTGPVLRLEAARIEVQAPEEFRVACGEFHVAAERRLRLQAGEDVQIAAERMQVRTRDDIRMNGSFVRLNCPE